MIETIVWHAVGMTMPDEGITVLVKTPSAGEPVWLGYLDDGEWHTPEGFDFAYSVTHWADLPAGPQ